MNVKFFICLFFNILLLIFGLISFFMFCFYMRSLTMRGDCIPPSKPHALVHRAYTQKFQENSLEAITECVKDGYGFEMDIRALKSGELVVFHDEDIKDLTGETGLIEKMTWDEVQKLRYLKTVRNYTYNTTPKIPLLSTVLETACKINPKIGIIFDVKPRYEIKEAEKFYEIIDKSPCSCKDQYFEFNNPFPTDIMAYKSDMT